MGFKDLKIKQEYITRLDKNFIKTPTDVQSEAIPHVLAGKNVIVKAQTGTGKTLAFLLPILSKIDEDNQNIQAVILTPTRELADQITKVGKFLTAKNSVGINSVFGGHRLQGQIDKLNGNTHIIVGTPGRILDHSRRGTINLKYLKTVVIDEADQMLNYGFIDDIYLVHSRIPDNQQMLLFSATMPDNIQSLIRDLIPQAKNIEITPQEIVVPKIKQVAVVTGDEDRRYETLKYLLKLYNPFMSIIFTKSKKRADELYNKLVADRLTAVEVLHGELSQSKRERILKDFRNLKFPILVSTDISARGIDVEGVSHIFNYDVPRDTEYYVHRIGRTGRMGKDGFAVTILTDDEMRYLNKIEKYADIKIPKVNDRSDYERSRIDEEGLKKFEINEPVKKTFRAVSKVVSKNSKTSTVRGKGKKTSDRTTKGSKRR